MVFRKNWDGKKRKHPLRNMEEGSPSPKEVHLIIIIIRGKKIKSEKKKKRNESRKERKRYRCTSFQ
jgi:hypothetical protein